MNTGIEILLVEDNPTDLELTMHALGKHNLANKIHTVRDGEEALDFLFCRGEFSDRTFENAPKVILLDLKLPKVDGLEVLRAIKADSRTKAIPVVIMTSSNQQRDLAEGYQLGVNSYIQKPINFAEFQEVIQKLGYYWLVINKPPPVGAFK
jgi:two-component system, response regulator